MINFLQYINLYFIGLSYVKGSAVHGWIWLRGAENFT